MVLLVLGVSCVFLLAAFAAPRSGALVALLAVGAPVVLWTTRDGVVSALVILILRVQSQDADVLRWACPWTPNGGACITDFRGLGYGALAVPAAVVLGGLVRGRRHRPKATPRPTAA